MALVEKPEYITEAGEAADGWPGDRMFLGGSQSLSLDDVIVLPGERLPDDAPIDVGARLSRNVPLNIPVACGIEASVSGASMAISMALKGGIGIIHRHQSLQQQAEIVKRVKQYETGFILNPITMSAHHTVADIDRVKAEWGCSGIPVTENGRMGSKLIGLVTSRDIEVVQDRRTPLLEVMTTQLVKAQEPVTLREARAKMQQTKVGKLPVVNEDGELVALICRGDLKRTRDHAGASRDANRQLLVGASCPTGCQADFSRAMALIDAGVDILMLDIDEGISDFTVEMVKRLKEEQEHHSTDLIAGRVCSLRQAKELLEAGIDGLRLGESITNSPPTASTIYEITRLARLNYGIPVLVDGVKDVSNMVKALFVGASSLIIDSIMGHTEEVPGGYFYQSGVRMSLSTCEEFAKTAGGTHPLAQFPEQGALTSKPLHAGSARDILPEIASVMRRAMQEVGVSTMVELHGGLFAGTVCFERKMPSFLELQVLHGFIPSKEKEEEPIHKVRLAVSSLNNRW